MNKLLDSITLELRWGDMDAYGHLNNTVYFRFFEEARVRLLSKGGFDLNNEGPVLLKCSATFYKEINYPGYYRFDQ